jgi:glycosyltransferase involved in cell wall biosynthesis
MLKKLISVVIPCYNDYASVPVMYERLMRVFTDELSQYDYEITYCEDCSPDDGKTWEEIRKICESDTKVRGVRNVRNFGIYRNPFAAMQYGRGDATFMIYGDMQDPPENLPQMIKYWEGGHKVVIGVRPNQYYNPFFNLMRKMYYGLVRKLTNNRQLEGANGFGLYDRSFVEILKEIDDMQPVLPGVVTEYGGNIKIIPIHQEKGGRDGKSNLNFWGKYDAAMVMITSYTKMLLRLMVFIGLAIAALSIAFALIILILKLTHWNDYPLGIPALTVGMFFLGGAQLTFLGIIAEYVLAINNRSMRRPLTVVSEKLNFGHEE